MMTTIEPLDGEHRPYTLVRQRYDLLVGPRRSAVQQLLDEDGDGLILITEEIDGEDRTYVTRNPQLIADYCDRLEAQRDAN